VTFVGFGRDRSGNVAIVFALLFPVLLGGAGLAVDYAYYTAVKGELQGAADAAATAGAVSLTSAADARAAALELAHLNVASNIGAVAEENDVELGIYDPVDRGFTVSSTSPNAVRVTTGRTLARGNAPQARFSAIWGYEHQEIHAVATAVSLQTRRNCVHALNASANDAFYMSGEAELLLPTCGVQVNSTAITAARIEGSATVTSETFNLAGGYSGHGFNPAPSSGPPLPDPYADLAEPAVPPYCTYTNRSFERSASFPAGTRFCGTTSFKHGFFTFMPGVHYFTGTSITFETTGDVIANQAMFYFGPNVNTRIAGKGNFQMSAMQSGAFAGIAIFQASKSTTTPTMIIEGGASLNIDAVIYTPGTKLNMAGNSGVEVSTGFIVADTVTFRGTAQFDIAPQNSRLPRSTQSALVH